MQKSILAALVLWSFCSPSYAEQSCEMIANVVFGANCQDGDIVKVSGTSASELPKIVQKYCDFDSQILTLADPTPSWPWSWGRPGLHRFMQIPREKGRSATVGSFAG